MDFLKNQFQRIQQQLSGLSASQKMLTGALVAIMVMTLVYWGRFASNADMEPLLDQAFAQQDIPAITAQLRGKGIRYDVQGDRVLVAADRKWEALADIAYAKLLPRNNTEGFDEMAGKLKPWASPAEREALYNRARETMCAQIISRFPGVDHAAVMIAQDSRRQLGRSNIEPTATVEIAMANGAEATKKLVEAAAATVAGAASGMAQSKINVIINGVHWRNAGEDATGVGTVSDRLEAIQSHERHSVEQIKNILQYIPNVFVSVAVKFDGANKEVFERKFDKKNVVSELKENRETKSSSNSGGQVEEDPGAVANTGLSVASPNGGGTSTSEETKNETFEVLPSVSEMKETSTAGNVTLVSASVRVPRSYFSDVLKSRSADGKAPTDAAVEQFILAELPRIRQSAMASVGLQNEKDVTVDTYADVGPLLASAGTPLAASMSVPMTITSYGKEIALGGLALVSLFMLMMMVKRSAPIPAVVAASISNTVPQKLHGGLMYAGEAGDGEAMLDAMELDEDAVKTQQMLDQVTTLVKDNPDAAASLVQRWMAHD